MTKKETLQAMGLEDSDIDYGNVGYSIEDMDAYLRRELMENRLMQGLRVPEEYIPEARSREEIDTWRRVKNMELIELERCQEDKSQVWPWTEKDEREWIEDIKSKGYYFDEDRVVGSVPIEQIKTKEETWNARWLVVKDVIKRMKK